MSEKIFLIEIFLNIKILKYFLADNSGECLDPETGLSHALGAPWSVSGCGEARCDLRQGTVFISYS